MSGNNYVSPEFLNLIEQHKTNHSAMFRNAIQKYNNMDLSTDSAIGNIRRSMSNPANLIQQLKNFSHSFHSSVLQSGLRTNLGQGFYNHIHGQILGPNHLTQLQQVGSNLMSGSGITWSNTCSHFTFFEGRGLLMALDLLISFILPIVLAAGAQAIAACIAEVTAAAAAANVAAGAAQPELEPEIAVGSAFLLANVSWMCATIATLEAIGVPGGISSMWVKQQLLCDLCHMLDNNFTPASVQEFINCPGNPCEVGKNWQNTRTPDAGHSTWPWVDCVNTCSTCMGNDGKYVSYADDPTAYKSQCTASTDSVCVRKDGCNNPNAAIKQECNNKSGPNNYF